MICRLRGVVREQAETHLVMDVQGISYQVFVPPSVMQTLSDKLAPDGEVELVTFHYQQLEVGKGVPVLIGFTNTIEREFFERFITVSGIGPKAALRALTLPIQTIARAIDDGDVSLLKSLRGIGEQRAKEIVAKLQGKVGKFALMQGGEESRVASASTEQAAVEEEAMTILLQLEYKKPEAKEMVRAAVARNPDLKTAEDVLNEVYRQRLSAPARVEPTGQARGSTAVVLRPAALAQNAPSIRLGRHPERGAPGQDRGPSRGVASQREAAATPVQLSLKARRAALHQQPVA